jgi:hypothetical protein
MLESAVGTCYIHKLRRSQLNAVYSLAGIHHVMHLTGLTVLLLVETGYHALSLKHNKPGEEEVIVSQERKQFDMPELLHNLDLLVDMAESAVIQNDKK